MSAENHSWLVEITRAEQPFANVPLKSGTTTVGRGPENGVVLPDPTVSKQHSQLHLDEHGNLSFFDLGSRNGCEINGIVRENAILQDGDTIRIGDFRLKFNSGQRSFLAEQLRSTPMNPTSGGSDVTVASELSLPEKTEERALVTLYNVCFWSSESIDESAFRQRCLHLLLNALRASDVQFYSSDGNLEDFATEPNRKPSIKLGGFVARKFQEITETSIMRGTDIEQKGQRKISEFQYLVAPLDIADAPTPPLLVVIRPTDGLEFTVDDRVLLGAVCRLWVRGRSRVKETQRLRAENKKLKQVQGEALLGESTEISRLRKQAAKIASTKAAVLILGETGSGKEVLARFIHENSPRADMPLVRVNCAAIPDSLIESVLFGHKKGAFTGADASHKGKFMQADGGTLFLDEIGEMPLEVQAKVLRALENGEIEVLGSEKANHVDVRLIAATHCDLEAMVKERRFREDLYFRLNVVKLHNPPLREHVEDIDTLAPMFLERFCEQSGLPEITISPAALVHLKSLDWPGNVRQLRNVMGASAIAAEGLEIEVADINEALG